MERAEGIRIATENMEYEVRLSLEEACQVVHRSFTQVEWNQYYPGEEYRLTCSQWPVGE